MSDRGSAEIFSSMFTMLAEDPTPQHRALARRLWTSSQHYDFHPMQMECNEALIRLGLARRGIDPEYPDEGETTLHGPSEIVERPDTLTVEIAPWEQAEAIKVVLSDEAIARLQETNGAQRCALCASPIPYIQVLVVFPSGAIRETEVQAEHACEPKPGVTGMGRG